MKLSETQQPTMDPPSEAPPATDPIDRASMDAMIHESRLSIPSIFRIPLASTLSFVVGMGLGTAHGSKMAGLQFRAEHAHKLPATPTGWFLYHKSKNYHVANGGIREGFKMGAKLSVVTTATFAIENMFDTYRGTKDFVNTVIACVTVAGGFSLWSKFSLRKPSPPPCVDAILMMIPSYIDRFSLPTAARTTKSALLVGLIYGGLQDLLGVARGRHIGYIDYLKKKKNQILKKRTTEPAEATS